MDMHTKLPSKMAKNCCNSDKKFNYLCCYLSAGAAKPFFNDILRNTDQSACIDTYNEYRLPYKGKS